MSLLQVLVDHTKLWVYYARGRRPFGPGYSAYKRRQIEKELRAGRFSTRALPRGYGRGLDERIVEYPWLFSRLPVSGGKLLDAGSALNHDFILEHPVLKTKAITICTLAPERHCYWWRGVSYLYEDLRATPLRDDHFDWVVCLSTLEHIGLDNRRFYAPGIEPENDPWSFLKAVREMARVLKPGGTLYLSVPYGRRANHGWLQVFDRTMLEEVRNAFCPRSVLEHYFLNDQSGWRVTSGDEAAEALYFDRHESPRLPASLPVAAQAVACIEMVK